MTKLTQLESALGNLHRQSPDMNRYPGDVFAGSLDGPYLKFKVVKDFVFFYNQVRGKLREIG